MAEHPAITKGLTVDGFAVFEGYASPLEEGQEEVLKKDDLVKIIRFEGEADIVVVKVDESGKEILDDEDNPIAERLFAEELFPAEDDADDGANELPLTDEVANEPLLAGATFDPSSTLADLRAVAADRGQTASGRSKADVIASLESMGAVQIEPKTAESQKEEQGTEPKNEADDLIQTTPAPEIAELASVTDVIAEEGGDALKAAKALVDRAEKTNFTLGGVLQNIQESGVFKTLGYEGKKGFEEYVETTLGIAYGKARYLIKIHQAYSRLGLSDIETRLEAIGWSKAKEIARIPEAELKRDFNKLEKRALDGTRDKLIDHIKTVYTVATRNTSDQVKLTSFNFKLAEEDATVATDALAAASKLTGEGDDLNKAFLYVLGEWAQTGTGQDLDLDATLELLGSRFGAQSIKFVDKAGEEIEWTPDAEEDLGSEAATLEVTDS